MKCRDLQIEIEERSDALSPKARLHLDECADCRKFEAEQTHLFEMLAGLERVAAPKDFNFQVRARIAQGLPNEPRTAFFPALRYVLPIGLVMAIVSFVALSGLFLVERQTEPQITQSEPAPVVEKTAPPENEVAETIDPDVATEPADAKETAVPEKKVRPFETAKKVEQVSSSRDISPPTPPKVISGTNNDGSKVLSVGPGQEVLTPRGLNANQQIPQTPPTGAPKTFTVTEVLSLIGIEIASDDDAASGRRVSSVTQNSPAQRSGVKPGDVIEAIDGKPLIGESLQEKSFQGEKLTVRRGGERLEIVIGTQ